MPTRNTILDILNKAYQIELDGYTFYSMTAERAEKPAVRALFEKLAADEQQHQQYLREVASHLKEQDPASVKVPGPVPDLSSYSDVVFTDEVRQQAEGAEFEAGVLSVGLSIESNSIAHYTGAAKNAPDERLRGFYQFLAAWERQHLIALQNAYKAVRGDFWQKSGF